MFVCTSFSFCNTLSYSSLLGLEISDFSQTSTPLLTSVYRRSHKTLIIVYVCSLLN